MEEEVVPLCDGCKKEQGYPVTIGKYTFVLCTMCSMQALSAFVNDERKPKNQARNLMLGKGKEIRP